MFLSQSVLTGERNLCGARLCHEIAHSWFGLAIGARDWTEEWISEGFATYLEDAFWNHVQKVSRWSWIFECLCAANLKFSSFYTPLHLSNSKVPKKRKNLKCSMVTKIHYTPIRALADWSECKMSFKLNGIFCINWKTSLPVMTEIANNETQTQACEVWLCAASTQYFTSFRMYL